MRSSACLERRRPLSYRAIVGSLLAGLILSLSLSIAGQTRSSSTIRSIDAYVRSMDAFVSSRKEPDLVVADTAEINASKPAWKRFESAAALDKAREEHETYTIAYNWKRNGRIAAANFTYFSPSGDWSQYVNHYFRSDGTLAMVSAELRTFMDDCVVRQRFYFNSAGKRLMKTLRYFDLNTDRPRKRCLGADALRFEFSTSIAKLPFSIR